MIAGSQAIEEVCFHMIADDRRTFCDPRSSAIIWKPAFKLNAQLETVKTTEQNCNNYYGGKESLFGASEKRII